MSMSRIKINLSFVPKCLSWEGVHLVIAPSESTCDGRFIIVVLDSIVAAWSHLPRGELARSYLPWDATPLQHIGH